MSLSYCHQKLSLALYEMCVSTENLKNRLRGSIKHGITAFPDETIPEGLREQFSEVKAALTGVRVRAGLEDYPDRIDRMKPSKVRRLLDQIISIREGVAREYYKRAFDRNQTDGKSGATKEDLEQKVRELMGS
jgi:hypothetical protein